MHHLLLITSLPDAKHQLEAIEIANALLNKNENIDAVFFYGAGVLHAQEEYLDPWKIFALRSNIALHLCKTSALNRQIIKDEDSLEISPPFVISSLALFFEILQNNPQLHQF